MDTRVLGFLLLVVSAAASGGPVYGGEPPPGPFANPACVACHLTATPEVVAAWRTSLHWSARPAADCVACHGNGHRDALSGARRNGACLGCHGGPKGSVGRSYATSKHGVIAAIEEREWDWSRPLSEANYRTPTCAYCHLYDGRHDPAQSMVSPNTPRLPGPAGTGETEEAGEAMREVCRDCHSPRYVDAMIDGGERTMEIARMKLREAEAAAAGSPDGELRQRVETMRTVTMGNLWLGVVHQSPDYQWWYGQAALDGDLLRVKAMVTRIRRAHPSSAAPTGGPP